MITHTHAEKARRLVGILRDPTRWPPGFVWDYSRYFDSKANCGCAMPLAVHAGLVEDDEVPEMARAFNMAPDWATTIFTRAHCYLGKLISDVTAEDVAGLIEKWLGEQEVSP